MDRKSKLVKEREYLYGLNEKSQADIINFQKNKCAICDIDLLGGRKTHFDHDHESGNFRGVLCSKCNTGLGLLGDNRAGLLKALDYLDKDLRKPKISLYKRGEYFWMAFTLDGKTKRITTGHKILEHALLVKNRLELQMVGSI